MLQMIRRFLDLLRVAAPKVVKPMGGKSESRVPPVPQPLDAASIYDYVTGIAKHGRNLFRVEVDDRGLSFGDLKVEDSFGQSLRFRVSVNPAPSLDNLRSLLADIVALKELAGVAVSPETHRDEICLILTERAPASMRGVWESGIAGDKPYRQHCFLKVRCLNGHPMAIEVFSVEATDVALRLVRRLGLSTEPAVYANESDIPLSSIIKRAVQWHDPEADAYFLEICYDPALVKSWVRYGGGWDREYSEDDQSVMVLASKRYARSCRLNNIPVPVTVVREPTQYMLKTAAYIRMRIQEQNTCCVEGCGRPVTREVHVTRWEMGDIGGTNSGGAVYRVCDNPDHAAKFASEGIRSSVNPAEIEAW